MKSASGFLFVVLLSLFLAPAFAAAESESWIDDKTAYSCIISPSSVYADVASSVKLGIACYAESGGVGASVPCKGVSWSSAIGSIGGDSESATFSAGTAAGTGAINAKFEVSKVSAACSIPATVNAGEPASIQISPGSASLSVGQAQQFSARVFDRYGNQVYVRSVSWAVSDAKLGSITAEGLFSAKGAGSGSVAAAFGGIRSEAPITISVPAQTYSCEISPSSVSTKVDSTVKLAATCYVHAYQATSEVSCDHILWSSTIGSVSGASGGAVFNSGPIAGAGKIISKTSVSGNVAECAIPAEVMAGEPVKVAISPSSAQLLVGGTLGFSAAATDEFGNKIEDARFFWSTAGGIGSVNTKGLFTAATAGSGTVRVDVSCMANPEEGCPHGVAQVTVSNPAISPGTTGGSTGSGTSAGGSISSSSVISFTCAGAPATLAVTLFSPKASVVADLRYMGSQPPTPVLYQNTTGSKTFQFTPPKAGAYELRVSVGVEQRSTSFTVPECTPITSSQVQNITVELKPTEQQSALPALPSGGVQQPSTQGSQASAGQQQASAAAGKQSLFGVELPSEITALAAIGALAAIVLLAASYFLLFGKKAEGG